MTMPLGSHEQARLFCEQLAARLERQSIRPQADQPYLDRYFAAGWSPKHPTPGPGLYLHHFMGSDPAVAVHSHPWRWSASLILTGGYREERCTARGREVREFRPGDVNVLEPGDRHRIDLLDADCWTLFLAGAFAQPWQFYPDCT